MFPFTKETETETVETNKEKFQNIWKRININLRNITAGKVGTPARNATCRIHLPDTSMNTEITLPRTLAVVTERVNADTILHHRNISTRKGWSTNRSLR